MSRASGRPLPTAEAWRAPEAWQPSVAPPPLLGALFLHTIAFVTDRRPSAAIQLAVRHNSGARVLVLAPAEHRERVHAMGASWADVHAHSNATRGWLATYRQGAPGPRDYWRFCHVRWLALAAALHARPPPAAGAIAVLDDDVLLFESLSHRLREAAAFHPTAHAETVVSGAYVLGSAAVLSRLAAFLWALYALPPAALADVAWRYGDPKPLSALNARERERLDPIYVRGEQYTLFTDMNAIDGFRFLSRSGQLPSALGGTRWAAGHRRQNCSQAPKLAGIAGASEAAAATAALQWEMGVPSLGGRPFCFVHLQGPAAKRQLGPMLAAAGLRGTGGEVL